MIMASEPLSLQQQNICSKGFLYYYCTRTSLWRIKASSVIKMKLKKHWWDSWQLVGEHKHAV